MKSLVLLAVFSCSLALFTDWDNYPDLFGVNGRRNEIDDKSVFFNYDRAIFGGFTVQWKGDFITIISVGTPTRFYELQFDLYTSGMWIYDESCRTSNKCGNLTGKLLFDRKSSLTLKDLNQPIMFGGNVIGDYVSDNISLLVYTTYEQKFGLATSVPIQTPQSGIFGIGLEGVKYNDDLQESPLRNLLSHVVQPSITVFADRSNETRRMGIPQSGSITIGKRDLTNCDKYFQFCPVAANSWIITLSRVVINDSYTDYSRSLVAFHPGQIYTYAPKSWTDVFYYKIGAKPVDRDGTLWTLDASSGFKQLRVLFFFQSSAILRFDLADFLLMPNSTQDRSAAYLTIRPNPNFDDPQKPAWIFGDDLLRKYCLELFLDSGIPQIGFSKNIWTPDLHQNISNLPRENWVVLLFSFLYGCLFYVVVYLV